RAGTRRPAAGGPPRRWAPDCPFSPPPPPIARPPPCRPGRAPPRGAAPVPAGSNAACRVRRRRPVTGRPRPPGARTSTCPAGTSIEAVSTTLSITDTPAHQIDADALVVAVSTGPGGPQLAPGTKDADDALGGTLAATLAALGATGEAGEVTKIATGGRPAAPLIAAVRIGAADHSEAPLQPPVLRRAA